MFSKDAHPCTAPQKRTWRSNSPTTCDHRNSSEPSSGQMRYNCSLQTYSTTNFLMGKNIIVHMVINHNVYIDYRRPLLKPRTSACVPKTQIPDHLPQEADTTAPARYSPNHISVCMFWPVRGRWPEDDIVERPVAEFEDSNAPQPTASQCGKNADIRKISYSSARHIHQDLALPSSADLRIAS